MGLVFLFMVAVAVAVVFLSLKSKSDFKASLKALSGELGIELKGGGSGVEGSYRGRKVLLDTMLTHVESGDMDDEHGFDVTYTRTQAWRKGEFKSMILARRRGIQTRLGKMFGGKDVKLGVNDDFDKRYAVYCDDEGEARRILDAGVQTAMVGLS
ncbi:MAG: hypothetical protein NTU61_01150, partial [Candidatus Altiarchaeota archaeon]|nr:hypothetical protein [Candidatus Altiarchaeota archaeon]